MKNMDNVICNVCSYGDTDIGPVRDNNEDNFFRADMSLAVQYSDGKITDEKVGLYILCDGMGGHQKGEVASALGVQELRRLLMGFFLLPNALQFDDFEALLVESLKQANDAIFEVNEKEGLAETGKVMGTTAIASLFVGNRCYVANVGDSRCYLINHSGIVQLTEDHNLATSLLKTGRVKTKEEAEKIWGAKMLTQALGTEGEGGVDPYVTSFEISESSYLLLSSDGLTDVVSEEEIFSIIKSSRGNLRKAVSKLIKRAYKNKTSDNTTVILVRFDVLSEK